MTRQERQRAAEAIEAEVREPDTDTDESEGDAPCRVCGGYGYHDDGEDMVYCGACRDELTGP